MTPILLVFFPLLLFQETAATDTVSGEAALHAYQRFLSGDSLTYEEKFSLARQLAHDNQWKEAIDFYTVLLNDYPDDPDLLLGRGLVFSWEGRFTEAEADLGTVTQGFPNYADAWMALGNLYLWWEKPHLAEQAYSKWVDLRPSAAAPYIARAKAFGTSRDFSKARGDLTKARELGGDQKEIDNLIRDLNRIPSALLWETLLQLDIQTFSIDRARWTTVITTFKREIPLGSVVLGIVQTHRFNQEDYALLADAYLNLWHRAYGNFRLQLVPERKVLPSSDATLEIYQGIGRGWEISGRYRRMVYPAEIVQLYGITLASYTGPWYLRGVIHFVPKVAGADLFGMAIARRYLGTVDDFLELGSGFGTEVEPGRTGPLFISSRVYSAKAQRFFHQRLGFTINASFQRTSRYDRWSIAAGLITRW